MENDRAVFPHWIFAATVIAVFAVIFIAVLIVVVVTLFHRRPSRHRLLVLIDVLDCTRNCPRRVAEIFTRPHCTELGSRTYSKILKQFAILTPPEVSNWACLLSAMPKDRLKRYVASVPRSIWEKFTAAAGRTPPSEGDVFTLAVTEFPEED